MTYVRTGSPDLERSGLDRPVVERSVVELEDERAARRPGRRRWRRLLAVVVVAVLAVAIAWLIWWSPVLAVREVRVLGATTVSEQDVRDAAGVALGTPLARVSAPDVTRRVAQLGPVRAAEVRYGWPDVLVVVVQERTPVAVVEENGSKRLVDATDMAYAPARVGVRLPVVDAEGAARTAAVAVVAGLPPGLSGQLSSVRAGSPDDVVLVLADGTRVRWGGTTDGDRKAEVALALLARHPRLVDVSAPELPTTRGGGASG